MTATRDPYSGLRNKGAQPGKSARKRKTHTNKKADRRGRVGAAKDAVTYAVPRSVAWCLTHPKQVKDKFTQVEWQMLRARYPVIEPGWGVANTSRTVGEITGYTGRDKQRREIEARAQARARELFFDWGRALDRWHRWKQGQGKRPSKHDFEVLAKYRRSRKGYADIGEVEPYYTDQDAMAVVKYDGQGQPYRPGAEELKVETASTEYEDVVDAGYDESDAPDDVEE